MPKLNKPGSTAGAPFSETESGPPERMMPFGFCCSIAASGVLNGKISEYTFVSRILRPISCVYWEPKSRMRIFSNINDIASHYTNGREPHEEDITVKNTQY